MSELVEAVWVGPSGYTLPDGTGLVPGETVAKLSEGEAMASANWEPVAKASVSTSGSTASTVSVNNSAAGQEK
jgi:hypothetical protein